MNRGWSLYREDGPCSKRMAHVQRGWSMHGEDRSCKEGVVNVDSSVHKLRRRLLYREGYP